MPRKRRAFGRNRAKAAATRQSAAKESVPDEEESQSIGLDDKPESVEAMETNEGPVEPPPEDPVAVTDLPEPEAPADVVENPPVTAEPVKMETASKCGIDQEYWSTLLTDKMYLADPSLGYSSEENLKQPLTFFNSDDELSLFPMIETMSAELYNIVQKTNTAQQKHVLKAIKSKKGVIKIPNSCMKAYLCHVNSMEPQSETSPGSKRTPHPFLLTEDENMFTEEKFQMLRAVLDGGWKREVVMRSPGSTGRKTGDVYYYSPDGTKFRSSKQVAQHLEQLQGTPFTIDNFSFAKVRISTNPDQEIVRKAYDGKPPPRSPVKPAPARSRPSQPVKSESSKPGPKPSSSKDSAEFDSRNDEREPVKGVSSRRSIQPPKRYSGDAVLLLPKRAKMQDDKHRNSNSKGGIMEMGMLPPKFPKGMEANLGKLPKDDTTTATEESTAPSPVKEVVEDSLFQISALRESGSIDVDRMRQYVENQKKLALKQAASAGKRVVGVQPRPPGSKGGAVIPCSIRCPGMSGVIPNLQCTNCLCLFHAECLGLPPNLMFSKKYRCSNCTEQDAASSSTAAGTSNLQKPIIKKQMEMRRGPPGLAPLPHGQTRGPPPGRDITVTLAGKEHVPARLPPKVGSVPARMVRGMMRARGGHMGPQVRSPAQRMMTADGSGSAITMTNANARMIRRVRGRPPAVPPHRNPPQVNLNRNVSITQLPRFQGPPPVPNLQPMSTPKTIPSKLPLPSMTGSKPRQTIAVPNLMKSNAFRVAVPPPSLSGRTFKKIIPPTSHQNPTNLRLNHPQGMTINRTPSAVYTTVQDRSSPLVKRSPQTVCLIGNKKFVVLPKNKKARDFIPNNIVGAMGNGGLSKGNYTVNEGRATPESTIKRINDDVPITEETMCMNSDNATNAKESVGKKVEESTKKEDTPISEQMLSYKDNENSQNSQEQGNGNINDTKMESRTLTDVDISSAD